MMAMYQLCRAKAAKHPFYIESIDINIYTIEELCFYLWKNVSLLDESILNEKLCDWLEGELGMQRLAFHLREKLKDAESIAELVLPVFREVRYLNAAEMYAVKEQIGKLEVQTEDIRRKIRASITACIPGRSAFTVRSCKTAIRGKQGFSFMQAY